MGRHTVKVVEEYTDWDHLDARDYPVTGYRVVEEYESYGREPENCLEVHELGDGLAEYVVLKSDLDSEEPYSRWYKLKSDRTIYYFPDDTKKVDNYIMFDHPILHTVIIPPSVEVIEPFAFVVPVSGCYNTDLTVTFTSEMKYIPKHLIPSNTSKTEYIHVLKNIDVPDSVLVIEKEAFRDMKLECVTIRDSVLKIGKGVFSNSAIRKLKIPESLWKQFKNEIFFNCKRIEEVVDGKKLLYSNLSGWWHNFEGITEIGDEAFACDEIMRKDSLLKNHPFEWAIKEVSAFKKLPSNLEYIGARAFAGCTVLVSILIPSTVSYIGDEAFKGCTNLEEMNVPDNLQHVGNNIFADCPNFKRVKMKPEMYHKLNNNGVLFEHFKVKDVSRIVEEWETDVCQYELETVPD